MDLRIEIKDMQRDFFGNRERSREKKSVDMRQRKLMQSKSLLGLNQTESLFNKTSYTKCAFPTLNTSLSPITKNIRYQLTKSVLLSTLPSEPQQSEVPKKTLESLLLSHQALDFSLSQRSKDTRVFKLKRDIENEQEKAALLKQYEVKMSRAIRKSKERFRETQALRKEANAKKIEEVRKRIAEQTKQFEERLVQEMTRQHESMSLTVAK